MVARTESEAYDRGVADGDIAARLTGHDKHFETINGSLAKIANELHTMNLMVQRLADQEVAEEAKRTARWLTLPRIGTVVAILVGLATVYFLFIG